jgi:OOP family OmpA-OmpF porin
LADLHFGKWMSDLLPQEYSTLNEIVNLLSVNPEATVVIAGHADNGGDKLKNIEISLKRAEVVKKYLTSKGIDQSRITTEHFGSDNPKYLNTTEAGKFLNRRAEVLIKYGKN